MAKNKGLKKGFTTGTCAAAAAKAALLSLFTGIEPKEVDLRLPIDKTVTLPVHKCNRVGARASASIIKYAGDDPDVTNGAEIAAEVRIQKAEKRQIIIEGGRGVGIVTKPGLAVPVGQPAINPVPIKMIKEAVKEVSDRFSTISQIYVTITVPEGEELSKKTLNARLGIIGGISILGTTGVVEPISTSVWKDTIVCALDVAVASGLEEVVFSTGRSSEKGAEKILNLPEEAFILVGDYMGYALRETVEKLKVKSQKSKRIRKITIAGQLGKLTKMASGYFDTHVKDSKTDIKKISNMAFEIGGRGKIAQAIANANTIREAFFIIQKAKLTDVFKKVTKKVCENATSIVEDRLDIACMLIGYNHGIIQIS